MLHPIITKGTLQFLTDLEKNNNREWFEDHRAEFKAHEKEVKNFLNALMELLSVHDEVEKLKLFRIYRDVRFSLDKTPYKSHLAGSFSRAGAKLRGGYYVHLKPGGSFIAAGFWEPNKEDLFRIRKELEHDAGEFRKIISDPSFKKIWGELVGEEVKTAPKGFDRAHPDIDLIKRKQFIFVRNFSDQQVMSNDFVKTIDDSFRAIRPYFDLMSVVLTTDLNGESLLN
jgi:uncharacterized protein (TIGR02453 family)